MMPVVPARRGLRPAQGPPAESASVELSISVVNNSKRWKWNRFDQRMKKIARRIRHKWVLLMSLRGMRSRKGKRSRKRPQSSKILAKMLLLLRREAKKAML